MIDVFLKYGQRVELLLQETPTCCETRACILHVAFPTRLCPLLINTCDARGVMSFVLPIPGCYGSPQHASSSPLDLVSPQCRDIVRYVLLYISVAFMNVYYTEFSNASSNRARLAFTCTLVDRRITSQKKSFLLNAPIFDAISANAIFDTQIFRPEASSFQTQHPSLIHHLT